MELNNSAKGSLARESGARRVPVRSRPGVWAPQRYSPPPPRGVGPPGRSARPGAGRPGAGAGVAELLRPRSQRVVAPAPGVRRGARDPAPAPPPFRGRHDPDGRRVRHGPTATAPPGRPRAHPRLRGRPTPPSAGGQPLNTLVPAARILLVDDDPAIQGVVSDLLEEAGHHLETAASCAAAMDAVTHADWDLVICDLRLPEGSGATLSQQIIAQRPELARRIILLTAEIGTLDEEL